MESMLPMLAPIISLFFGLVIALSSIVAKNHRVFWVLAFIGSIIVSLTTFKIWLDVAGAGEPLVYGGGGWPPPIGIVYIVDGLSALMGVITSILIMLVVAYSYGYFGDSPRLPYYYTLIMILESALLGCYYTGDFFNLFVMVELMAVSAYSLVAYRREKGRAVEAAIKYGIVAALAGILFFISLGFMYAYESTLSMPDIAARITGTASMMYRYSGSTPSPVSPLLFIFGLLIWSLLVESAVFPVHFWLPDAHSEAPSPVSAVLSGLVVNVGLYAIIRTTYTVGAYASLPGYTGFAEGLLALGCIGSLYGAVMMLIQRDVKRLIAYSTVMHVSLILIGISLLTSSGLSASVYHFIAHSISKSLAFLSIGVLILSTGTRCIDGLRGMARINPLAAGTAILAFLGLAGMPPLGTFPSKLLLITACIDSGSLLAAGAIIVSSALAAVAYFRVIHVMINEPPTRPAKKTSSASMNMVLVVLAVAVVLVGTLIPIFYGFSEIATSHALNTTNYIDSVNTILQKYQ